MSKILVVDDNVSVRTVIERALTAWRFDVAVAASGEEAIQRLEVEEPDLIICDVVLPDKNGYQVCEHVRSHPRLGGTPVLLISGMVSSAVLQRAAEVRSNDVLFKPFAAEDLVRKVDELLGLVSSPPASGLRAVAPPPAPAVSATPAGAPDCAQEPPPAWAPALGVKGCLEQFVAIGGVRCAVLADRDGLLIESAGSLDLPADATAALAGCLAESSDGLGRELGRGGLIGMMLEYESCTLVLHGVGASAMLAIVVDSPAVLGKVRYHAKKVVPEISRALSSEVLACQA